MSASSGGSDRSALLDALRARTSSQHQALDAALTLTTGLTPARYDAFLRASLAVVDVLEPAVARWLGPFEGPDRRERLRADRAALAARCGAIGGGASEPHVEVREPSSLAEAFGCAYVLEGSTLGGVVLARAVQPALGLGDEGTSYLRLRGERTGELWRGFVARLEDFGAHASAADHAAACELAAATFDAYRDAFARAGALSA